MRYIEIVQSRSRLDQIVDSIIFQSGSRVQVPLLMYTAIDVDPHQDQ